MFLQRLKGTKHGMKAQVLMQKGKKLREIKRRKKKKGFNFVWRVLRNKERKGFACGIGREEFCKSVGVAKPMLDTCNSQCQ